MYISTIQTLTYPVFFENTADHKLMICTSIKTEATHGSLNVNSL